MSRRSIVWLITVPLAVTGTQLAHALAYRLVTPEGAERSNELSATGHAYLGYLPLALAVGTVLVLLALVAEIRQVASRDSSALRPRVWSFAALAPAIFFFQEHFERLAHEGGFPWDTTLAPSFVVGLLLQLPFALVACALARLLLSVAQSLSRLLARPPRQKLVAGAIPRPAIWLASPRLPALALGYGSRGPPAFRAA